jgi:aminocarboxymuconate-semialdehyde decarboxylase
LAQTRDLARQCNDYLASLAQDHPDRFGGFAFLPLPDIDASLVEIERVVDVLKLDGVCLLTSVDERYMGHPDFEPVYEELNRRRVVTFIHPCYPPGTEARDWNIPRMIIDYPFETTRVATNLIMNGVMERHRDIPFILSHAGGTLPFLAHRLVVCEKMTQLQDNYPEGVLAYIKRFYFDTALSGDKVPLDALSAIVDPSRILFGSDYPYVSEEVAAAETAGFDAYGGFDEATFAAINRGNAEKLFPRFAG